MYRLLFIILLIGTSCSSSEPSNDSTALLAIEEQNAKVEIVDSNQFEKLMEREGVILVDVRTDGEIAQGMIPGAIQIDISDFSNFEKKINNLDKNSKILVYCKVGGRSARAAQYMEENGFGEIYDLKGGFTAWEEAGKQIEIRKK